MNLSKLFLNVGTQLSIARCQMSGAPPVCTAQWTDQDFERWEANQRRVQDRHFRLHKLHARIGKQITKREMKGRR
jgi:hypothetical protein